MSESVPTEAAAQPSLALEAAPVVEAPAAPAVAVEAAPAPVVEPVVEAPVVEATPEAPAAPAEVKTLLEDVLAEGKPEGEPAPEAPPADLYVYADFVMPEGVNADPAVLGKFKEIAGAARLPQEAAQGLVDLWNESAAAFATNYAANFKAAEDQKRIEAKQAGNLAIMADEELGGAGYETTKSTLKRVVELGVRPANATKFNEMLGRTGVGAEPEFWRLLNNLSRRVTEPVAPPAAMTPPKGNGQIPNAYAQLYTHPTSQVGR